MEDIIALLHLATKDVYDCAKRILDYARELSDAASRTTEPGALQLTLACAARIQPQAQAIQTTALNLKREVQSHENSYPTKAIFEFRLWRVMDAVGYALSAQAAVSALTGDQAMAALLDKQAETAFAEAMEHYRRAREHEADMGKPAKKRV